MKITKNPEDASLFLLLHQMVSIGKYRAMKKLEAYDLKPSQVGILFILKCNDRLSQKQLAEKIGITPPSMTVAIRKLEGRGYIIKKQDEEDQRITRIQLSEKGKDCIEQMQGILEEQDDLICESMTPEEGILFRRLVLEARQNLLNAKEFKNMDMETIIEKTKPDIRHEFS